MTIRILDRATGAIVAALAIGLIAVLSGVIDAGPLDPSGAPAPTNSVKLPGTPISSVPFPITESGHYYLAQNLVYGGSGNAIEIAESAKFVSIDLGGFTLSGVDAGTGIKALGAPPPFQFPLQITNGYVRDFAIGIDMQLAAHSRMDDVHVFSTTSDGIRMGSHDVLSNCTVALSGGYGVNMAGALASMTDCYVVDNALSGVLVTNFGNVVEGSQIVRNNTSRTLTHASVRLAVQGPGGNIVRGNDLNGFDNEGVYQAVSIFRVTEADNVIIGNTLCGLSQTPMISPPLVFEGNNTSC